MTKTHRCDKMLVFSWYLKPKFRIKKHEVLFKRWTSTEIVHNDELVISLMKLLL